MADSQRKTANLFDVSTVEKGRIDNGEVGYVSQTSSLTIEGGTVNFRTTVAYRGVCSGFFEIPEGTETITFNFIRNEALGVKFVFYDNNKVWLEQDYVPTLQDIPPASASIPTGAKYVRLSFTGQISGGYSYTMTNLMLNTGSTPLPYEPYWLHSLRKLTTAADTITTLPADLYADGTNATVGLVGNMQQTDTPTPQNPIQPQETGEMTANLFDGTTSDTNQRISIQNGATYASNGYSVTQYIEIEPSTRYTHNKSYECYYALYDENKSFLYGSGIRAGGGTSGSFANAKYLRIDCSTSDISTFMVIEGTTLPSEYIPYGIKIPISSANTTTPVYLGEVESTRQIKKLVLTGEESGYSDWKKSTTYQGSFYAKVLGNMGTPKDVICSHAEYTPTISASTYVYGKCGVDGSNPDRNLNLFIGEASWTVSDFKAYLQQQYAADTPVTVWYVLANPTTGIVNEPLRKIGDYADTVSGVSIPTITGKDSFDVLTTLKPFEVSLAYTGWHDATVKEWDGSEWQ